MSLNVTNTRREFADLFGRFRAGKLAPVGLFVVKGGESGILQQHLEFQLDPVAGRLLSQVHADVFSVAVPLQAMLQLTDPLDPELGVTELIRHKLLSGTPIDALVAENEISKRLGVNPRPSGGVKQVTSLVRLAHNAAVNFLRQSKYDKATLLPHNNVAVTPALLGSTILERLNAVLDPDDHINGSVQLDMPNLRLPVGGIYQVNNKVESKVDVMTQATALGITVKGQASSDTGVTFNRKESNPAGTELDIYADFSGVSAGGVSLVDFYNAQRVDEMTRTFAAILKANPVDGEDQILRHVYGLSVDDAKQPWMLYQRSAPLSSFVQPATDGEGMLAETQLSRLAHVASFSTPLPRHELGYMVLTFASIRPDETIYRMPHPYLSQRWTLPNRAAESLKLDPVQVIGRDVYSDIAQASETTVMFYTGHNELKRAYSNVGLNGFTDPTTVENKTTIWQYAIPASVTPNSILYPETLDQYPFLDANAEICTYEFKGNLTVQTPEFFGPSPVETIDIINDEDIFDEA